MRDVRRQNGGYQSEALRLVLTHYAEAYRDFKLQLDFLRHGGQWARIASIDIKEHMMSPELATRYVAIS